MLRVYTLKNKIEWDEIVTSFINYDVYYLSSYVAAFEIHGDGTPLLFYYCDDKIKGINVVMKRDIALCDHFKGKIPQNTFFDFATPYGYGGWILEGDAENSDRLFSEYEKWCSSNNIVSEFVRFHPVINNFIFSENDYEIMQLGKTVCLDISSPEIIWANISSKNRNVIRKAEKSGVEIFTSTDIEMYENFARIYNKTMENDNANAYYFFGEKFYESVHSDLADNSKIFYAKKDNEIIAASIMIFSNGKLNYHLSGSLFEYRTFAPSNLLLYKAALWGCDNGCKTFHLGGGVGSGEDSLFKFKKSFYRNDDLTQFSIGKKIFIKSKYDELVKMHSKKNSSFFPMYRA